MKRIIRSFLLILVLSFLLQVKSFAYSTDPEKFIGEIIEEAKLILNSSDTKEIKAEKLSIIALKTVDVNGIGYYTLGKKRKDINPDQLSKYRELFEKYFLKSFTSRLTDYSDPKIDVITTEVLNPKYTIVKSLLLATDKRPEVKIDWRVYTKDPNKPLIRDLIIEGLSLARTQKEEFASVIESNNGDVSKLFDTLREFVKK